MPNRRVLFILVTIGFLILDQWVKVWARHALHIGEALALPLPGIFEIELVYNQGIAFGQFQGKGVLLSPIAIAISLGAVIYIFRNPQESKWNHVAFGLLASGAMGNLIDRLKDGRVTDMFWFRLINFPVFNIADSCITVATIMLIIGWWRDATRPQPAAEVVEVTSPAAEP